MSEKRESNPEDGGQSWTRVLVTASIILAVVVGIVASARLIPITNRYYTDAELIRVPAKEARTRDILWQPSRELSELINTRADDYEPRLSADGVTLFFVRGKAGENADIYVSVKTPQGWSDAAPLMGVNSEYDDLGPEPSADGESLYFYSDRPGGSGGYDLWVAHRGLEGWQPPINMGPSVNSEFNDYGPALTPDGTNLYFASNRPQPTDAEEPDPNAWRATLREDLFQRDYDLYVSIISDAGTSAARALELLNTPYNDGAPAVSSFGDFLYFASDRPGGEGAFDLYRSRRLEGRHRTPENLGSAVNTGANELDPGLSLGGYALYFSSDRSVAQADTPSDRKYDLYYTTSREVFSEAERVERPPINWAGLWRDIGPNLLLALLALLLLLALLALLRGARGRRLSLLAKCLLASVTAHVILLLLFNVWEVTASIARELHERGRIQIALASPAAGSELFTQIRGELTSFDAPAMEPVSAQRHETRTEIEPVEATASLRVARHTVDTVDQPEVQPDATDAAVAMRMEAPTPVEVVPDTPIETQLDVALPAEQARTDVSESDSEARVAPVESAPTDRPPVSAALRQFVQATEIAPVTPDDPSDARPRDTSLAGKSAVREASPANRSSSSDPSRALPPVDSPALTELSLPTASVERLPEAAEFTPSVSVVATSAARRELNDGFSSLSTDAPLQRLTPSPGAFESEDTTFASTDTAVALDIVPLADVQRPPVPLGADFTLPELAELAIDSPGVQAATPTDEADTRATPAVASSVRRTLTAELQPASDEGQVVPLKPEAIDRTQYGRSLAAQSDMNATESAPTSDMAERLTAAVPAPVDPGILELSDLALPTMEQATLSAGAELSPEVRSVETSSPRASLGETVAVADVSMPDELFTPRSTGEWAKRGPSGSLALVDAATRDAERTLPSVAGFLPGADATLLPPSFSLDLSLPTEAIAPDNPYAQRLADDRLSIVERMGGTVETEKAVADALRWLAAHQSADGHWDGEDFDDGCGACGGETDIAVEQALTGLSLLAFLGSGHTHVTDGPYQGTVKRGVRWLLAHQGKDGDLRGEETMYSHGIAAIALSEAYGMSGDDKLVEAVRNAVRFIDAARNTDEGGWRYDPGQAGDTSVLGWQVMALKSANLNGIPVAAESFDAARKWLDKVSRRSRPGLYAYRPGRKYTPSMTAEGMLTQQLLGHRRDEPRMQQSAAFVVEHLPDWDGDANTYYWYYGTFALFQHQGDAWRRWNEAVTRELLSHQRKDGRTAGSWDPDGEWADVGGRVYQTALCALTLEVYYRYLPLTSIERPEDAIGAIEGLITDASTGKPLPGASVRLVLPDREPATATSDSTGRYRLFVPEVPSFFALSTSHEGYVPGSKNVDAAMLEGTTLTLDFNLAPASRDTVAIEAVPDVHHLGDNAFSGSINSQFQKESEGARYEAKFLLRPDQVPPHVTSATVELLAKGVQRRHTIRINGTVLDDRLEDAPDDGSFGEFSAAFDPSILRAGRNTFEIIAKPSSSDIDDFEFVNVRIRLNPRR